MADSIFVSKLRAALERMPSSGRAGDLEAWVREQFAEALSIKPEDVAVRWDGLRLVVVIPQRLHYAADFDALEQLVSDIRLAPVSTPALTDDQFGHVMRGLRGA